MPAPFFIVGTQRSGTTLLYQMLNCHPELYVVNEFWDLYPHLTGEKSDPRELERVLVSHLALSAPYLAEGEAPPSDPFAHLERAFASKLAALGKRRWGIKHPRLTYYLDFFVERYPEARFVILVRDARGVVSSYLQRKMNVANVFYGARLWQDQVRVQTKFAARAPAHCHLLRYEDLLAHPESELRRICRFLNEEFTPALLEYYRHEPDTALHGGNINITKPVQTAFAEKWQRSLSPRQIAVIETVAGSTMAEHGYRPTRRRSRVSRLERLAYALHQKVMTAYWWQRRSNWSGIRRRLGRLASGLRAS